MEGIIMKKLIIVIDSISSEWLMESVGEAFSSQYGYNESHSYIITTGPFYNPIEEKISVCYNYSSEKSPEEQLCLLSESNYRITKGKVYSDDICRLDYLMSRGDIDKVIWQYPKHWDLLCKIDSYKKRTEWMFRADSLFFEDGRYALAKDEEMLSNIQFKNYLAFAHAVDTSVQLISTFFSEAIRVIYNRTFYGWIDDFQINDIEMCLMGSIYEKESKYFNEYDFLHSEWRETIFDSCPIIYHNRLVKFKNMLDSIDGLLKNGLIDKDKRFKIKHTEKGKCVYEIVKKCIPEFMNVETLIYWRNRAFCIATGEITECEYISEVLGYTRNAIKQSANLIDTEEIWRRVYEQDL